MTRGVERSLKLRSTSRVTRRRTQFKTAFYVAGHESYVLIFFFFFFCFVPRPRIIPVLLTNIARWISRRDPPMAFCGPVSVVEPRTISYTYTSGSK